MTGLRVLVCGGRDFDRHSFLYNTLDNIQDERGDFEVVIAGRHPGEKTAGADLWAESRSFMACVPFYGFPARWGDLSHADAVIRQRADGTKYDAKAGPRRNGRMIAEGRPTLVVAFPRANGRWGPGTRNMISQAKAAGIEVVEVEG